MLKNKLFQRVLYTVENLKKFVSIVPSKWYIQPDMSRDIKDTPDFVIIVMLGHIFFVKPLCQRPFEEKREQEQDKIKN